MLLRVVLLTRDPALRDRLLAICTGLDCLVSSPDPDQSPWEAIDTPDCDLVLLDRRLPSDSVTHWVTRMRQLERRPAILVLTGSDSAREQAELVAEGVLGVLSSELPQPVLEEALRRLIESARETLARAREQAAGQLRFGDFITHSPRMRRLIEIARRVSQASSSVLVLGETGVGKERLARAIHAESPRAAGPFVDVNCGAIPEQLLESELFGHERGAFTGAERAHRGRFELAHGGTIFLDEIGEMPPHLQVKLLRVLQDRQIQRIGAERPIPVDARVIAATNRDPAAAIESKTMRADLYYRISVVTLTIPPLRERAEDIPVLAASYLEHFAAQIPSTARGFSREVTQALAEYSWPGNVRELINVVERAVLLAGRREIDLADLPETITGGWLAPAEPERVREIAGPLATLEDSFFEQPLRDAKRACAVAFERLYLERLLRQTGGAVGETARRAGIVPRSLHTKMKELGLRKEAFRPPGAGSAADD